MDGFTDCKTDSCATSAQPSPSPTRWPPATTKRFQNCGRPENPVRGGLVIASQACQNYSSFVFWRRGNCGRLCPAGWPEVVTPRPPDCLSPRRGVVPALAIKRSGPASRTRALAAMSSPHRARPQPAFPPIEAEIVKKPRGGPVQANHVGKVYRRRFVSTRLAATLLADGAPCFAICACPALVFKRDRSYISIHSSLEIAEISLPIASSGKSSGDSKFM